MAVAVQRLRQTFPSSSTRNLVSHNTCQRLNLQNQEDALPVNCPPLPLSSKCSVSKTNSFLGSGILGAISPVQVQNYRTKRHSAHVQHPRTLFHLRVKSVATKHCFQPGLCLQQLYKNVPLPYCWFDARGSSLHTEALNPSHTHTHTPTLYVKKMSSSLAFLTC